MTACPGCVIYRPHALPTAPSRTRLVLLQREIRSFGSIVSNTMDATKKKVEYPQLTWESSESTSPRNRSIHNLMPARSKSASLIQRAQTPRRHPGSP